MTAAADPAPPAEDSAPALWGAWATLDWGAAAIMVPTAIVVVGWELLSGDTRIEDEMRMLAGLGGIVVVAVAARMRGFSALDYLALTVPRAREFVLGIVSPIIFLAAYFAFVNLVGLVAGKAPSGHLAPTALIATILVIPVCEEVIHRGFLYRGLAQSRLRPWGAITVIAVIFAFGHVGGLLVHFWSGVFFGWVRRHTESTTVAIIAHATSNLAVILMNAAGIGQLTY